MSAVQNIVVAGKSGAGKQPRIDVLVERFGLQQLSTGNIFRRYLGAYKELRRAEPALDTAGLWSEEGGFAPPPRLREALAPAAERAGVPLEDAVLGFQAAQYVDRGLFVPDSITNALFEAAFSAAGGEGLVLDGYPRTVPQSEFLLELCRRLGTRIDLVLVVEGEDEAIVKRTVGRRICPSCGRVYHLEYKPPAPDGTCPACGTPVVQRSDDTEEKIRSRLREFHEKAWPAILRLEAAGIPRVSVPGNLPVFTPEAVAASVAEAVDPVLGA